MLHTRDKYMLVLQTLKLKARDFKEFFTKVFFYESESVL